MTILLNATITTAVTASTTTAVQLRPLGGTIADNVLLQGNFTYGSGGTTADAWVQTSVDGGGTWIDIANLHFTTASKKFVYNLSSLTPITTEYDATSTDGALAANTSKDGIIGTLFRVKYTTTGTYAGGTTMRVDAVGIGFTATT
jgi:hypothetical protein